MCIELGLFFLLPSTSFHYIYFCGIPSPISFVLIKTIFMCNWHHKSHQQQKKKKENIM